MKLCIIRFILPFLELFFISKNIHFKYRLQVLKVPGFCLNVTVLFMPIAQTLNLLSKSLPRKLLELFGDL